MGALTDNYIVHSNDRALGESAAILEELSKLLWTNGKRFQVVIDCNPATGKVEMVRRESI